LICFYISFYKVKKIKPMVCGICGIAGHNRRSCTNVISPGSPVDGYEAALPLPTNSLSTRVKWKTSINEIKIIIKFFKCCFMYVNNNREDIRMVYLSWLKYNKLNKLLPMFTSGIGVPIPYNWSNTWGWDGWTVFNYMNVKIISRECIIFHNLITPRPPQVENILESTRAIELNNLHNTNYLVYWVIGNNLITDLDLQKNNIKYIGMIHRFGKFSISTISGHRFYIVPHRIDTVPAYHPQCDTEFFVEPFCQINIHDGTTDKIFLDDKGSLSELNKWKFNALKLDFLIKEIIKLGGKNNDVLECVLDLHQDIIIGEVTEMEKDMAGIPSTFTNIT